MRTPVLAAVLLAAATAVTGCGRAGAPGAAVPVALPAPVAVAPQPATQTDEDALAALAALEPTGADWEEKLAALPEASRRPIAVALLREGDFACKAVVEEEYGCGIDERSFEPLDPEATLEEPCLRRQLALWAVGQLEPVDVPAVADELEALVRLPEPETELARSAFDVLPARADELRLQLIAAAADVGRDSLADEQVAKLSPAAAARALVDLGREVALDHLGPRPSIGVLTAALARGLSPSRALEVLDRLGPAALDDAEVARTVRAVAADAACEVSARAIELLVAVGDPEALPSTGPLADDAAATRALCVASHLGAAELGAVVARLAGGDVELVSVERDWDGGGDDDPDPDGDGDPYTTTTRDTLAAAAVTAGALAAWIPTSCDDGVCRVDGKVVTLGFGARADGTPTLDTVTVEDTEWEGCGC